MTEMLKDVKFYGIIAGYLIGLTAIIICLNAVLNNIFASFIIGFVLSGFILIGISLLLIKDDREQNKVTEYNFEKSKELLEE